MADATESEPVRCRVVCGECTPDQARQLLAAHAQALAAGGEAVLKDGRRSAVTRVRLGGAALCVKEYRYRGWLDRLKDLLRGRRARRAWRAAARLAACGIETPQAVAVIEHAGRGFFVTRFVDGAVGLDVLLPRRFGGALSPGELAARRAMVRQLGRWLRKVHDCGLYHDDWSAKNVLAIERDGRWAFYLLDVESVSRVKRLTRRRRIKNLGQIGDAPGGDSSTDPMRFLLAYAAGDRALTRGRFPRQVLAATRRRRLARARGQDKSRKRKAKARRKARRPSA
jgi:tRNA A-37 threonylcarbamoyl transferase component Bud32